MEDFISNLQWSSPKNLVIDNAPLLPTIVKEIDGTILGLVYSSQESLTEAFKQRKGIYYSRTTKGIWVKSPNRVNGQTLLKVETDCDRDALIFTVKQYGVFCHLESRSCFKSGIELSPLKERTLTIGYAYGRSENAVMDLFASVGIHVFKSAKTRDSEYMVKTQLHDSLKLVGCKPRDLSTFLKTGVIDVAVCFSDAIDDTLIRVSHYQERYPKEPKTVKIVSIVRPDYQPRNDGSVKICTEYQDSVVNNYISSKFGKKSVFPVHGNTEHYVRYGYADIGITVCDSGKTLSENGLIVLDVISTPKLGFFFSADIYDTYPRFFRELSNNLNNDTIFFYSVDGPYGFMSNFYPCRFTDAIGEWWSSSEHYYQAHKFLQVLDSQTFELVRSQLTAKQCYKTAYLHQDKFRPDWLDVKDIYMKNALDYKFHQNPELMKALMATKGKLLVEHALKDYHYGCGADGSGENILGKMLMEIRDRTK